MCLGDPACPAINVTPRPTDAELTESTSLMPRREYDLIVSFILMLHIQQIVSRTFNVSVALGPELQCVLKVKEDLS